MNGTFYQDTPVPAPDHLGTPGYTITGRKPLNTLPLLTPESTQRVRFERVPWACGTAQLVPPMVKTSQLGPMVFP